MTKRIILEGVLGGIAMFITGDDLLFHPSGRKEHGVSHR